MRVAVYGTGSIGMRHLRVLQSLPGVEPIAVPTRPGRATDLQAEGFDAVPTLEAALERQPAGVLVATDTGRHTADAVRALAAGCHVLVEKPMAANHADAAAIVAAARAGKRSAHVACNLRFDPGLRWLRGRLSALGRVRLADAECVSWLPGWRPGREVTAGYASRPAEGGVLLDLVHEIDYTAWLLGPQRQVTARLQNRGILGLHPSVEETAVLLALHDDDVPCTVRLSYVVQPTTRLFRLWGDHGRLEWNGVARVAHHVDPTDQVRDSFSWEGPMPMYEAQAKAWIAALRGEPAADLVDAEEGARALAVCDAARAAGVWTALS